ncbi:MAG: hypothetical protein GEU75_05160 [Dehalococcoidia bacterium]|nr:hypothetical protein [Dehalococcoidia bacterium]
MSPAATFAWLIALSKPSVTKVKVSRSFSFGCLTGGVCVIGASVIQQCIRAGLADELHTDIMPVLLGGGLRLFEGLDIDLIQLEKLQVLEHGQRTSLRFRFLK